MKIALCLSGQPRYLQIGYKHLYENIISKYDVDVFSHIWFDESLVNKDIEFSIPYNRSHKWEKDVDKKLIDLYKPKKWLFEQPKQFSLENFLGANFEAIAPNNVLSMFYSIKQANNLRQQYELEKNIQYDLVIRSRTDCVLNINLNLHQVNKNTIYCYGLDQTMFNNFKICNDQFAIGDRGVMDIYCELYNLLEYYWKTYQPPSMVGERILTTHLYYSKVLVQCCKAPELDVNIYKG